MHVVFLLTKTLNSLGFQSFVIEVYLLMVISETRRAHEI